VSVIGAAAEWVMSAMSGPAVTAIMTIAVAVFAVSMLAGRLSIRQGLRLVLGCFILTGSAEIAQSVTGWVSESEFDTGTSPTAPVEASTLAPLGPKPHTQTQSGNPFDPYAGAKPVQ
jgi:type IV secretion system protein VirB2